MRNVSSRQARQKLRELLDIASQGQTVSITRRGQEVARLVPPQARDGGPPPDLTEFRRRLKAKVRGGPLSRTVIAMRNEERA